MRHRNQQCKNIKWAMFFFMTILMFGFTFVEKLITFKFIIPIPFLLQDISTIITILWGNSLDKNELVSQHSC